jgi:hypothetical protein
MLLCTNKANIVFAFVDEKFGNRDISPVRTLSRGGSLHIEPVRLDEGLGRLAAVERQAQAAQAA